MTTCRFSLPGAICARLASLILAADHEMVRTPLAHIALSLRGNQARFAATDGKILALLRTEVQDHTGAESLDLLLDGIQLADAAKAQAKVKSKVVSVLIDTDVKEVRFGSQHAAGLIALRDGQFPHIDGIMTKHHGGTWVPSMSSFDLRYLRLLPKLTGKASPLLCSVATDGTAVAPIWAALRPKASREEVNRSIPVADVARLTCAPGWYRDHELLVLVMPISRPEEGSTATFDQFLLAATASVNLDAKDAHATAA